MVTPFCTALILIACLTLRGMNTATYILFAMRLVYHRLNKLAGSLFTPLVPLKPQSPSDVVPLANLNFLFADTALNGCKHWFLTCADLLVAWHISGCCGL